MLHNEHVISWLRHEYEIWRLRFFWVNSVKADLTQAERIAKRKMVTDNITDLGKRYDKEPKCHLTLSPTRGIIMVQSQERTK